MVQERRRLLTVAQAAAALGVSGNTLRNWADKGLIPHVKTPTGYRRFDPDEIEAFRAKMEAEGKAAA
jgi:excisionase family DNA binding protein